MEMHEDKFWDYVHGESGIKKNLHELRDTNDGKINHFNKSKLDYVKEKILSNGYLKAAVFAGSLVLVIIVIGKLSKILSVTLGEFHQFKKAFNKL